MMKPPAAPLLPSLAACLLSVHCLAQFTDPGFEQGGTGWTIHCGEYTWLTASDAPYGGSAAMAVQAASAAIPVCPEPDPDTAFDIPPRFYQQLPQLATGDVVRVKFITRVEDGSPVPSGSVIGFKALTVDQENVLHYPGTAIDGGGDLSATWSSFSIQLTVPELPAGHVFALGFSAHAFGGGNAVVYFDNMALLVEGSGARLQAKAWLDAAFVPGTNLMRDDLRAAGLIPTTLPNHINNMMGPNAPEGTGISIDPAVLTVTGNNAIVDWVWVELCFGTPDIMVLSNGFEMVAKRYALIQRDGDIVDLDGTSPVQLPIKAGNCRVVVRHKNHLGVMSAEPLALNVAPATFETRAANTPLFAMNTPHSGPARKTVGNTRTLWPGDGWTLGYPNSVKYTGPGNDRDMVLYTVGGTTPTNVVSGYLRYDLNMDGAVKYTGPNNDRDIILQTIGGSTPTAVRYEQVP